MHPHKLMMTGFGLKQTDDCLGFKSKPMQSHLARNVISKLGTCGIHFLVFYLYTSQIYIPFFDTQIAVSSTTLCACVFKVDMQSMHASIGCECMHEQI